MIEVNNLHYRDGKNNILTIPKKGNVMDICATFNETYICCRVHVLKSVQNCPYECTYCFLQNYLNNGITKSVEDIETLMKEVKNNITAEPLRMFRVGTWELGDSLALEYQTGQAAALIKEFADLDNAVLELKTKSDCIDAILDIDHKGKTVISWSLNTEYVIENEEHKTASLDKRLDAMRKAAEAGYLTGLHFDPMILHDGWEEGYSTLIRRVFEAVTPDRIAWISMGSLRFNPEMKKKIENNYPDSKITCPEMVIGNDAKMRYVKPLRVQMYRHAYNELKKYVLPDNLVYLCMERWDVWEKVFGSRPDSVGHLDHLFAASLHNRYGLGCKPDLKQYEKI